jgi:hypothetical protein
MTRKHVHGEALSLGINEPDYFDGTAATLAAEFEITAKPCTCQGKYFSST